MDLLRSRVIAWLCLALVLLSGSAPAQGLVLCVESDGCVRIELRIGQGACAPCDDHADDDHSGNEAARPADGDECPCVDYVVPGFADERIAQQRSLDLPVFRASSPTAIVGPAVESADPSPGRAPPPRAPRVSTTLRHVRTVVLLR